MDVFLQLTVSGLSNGMVYALAAVGFVVIYKPSDVINAQGELLLFGAYLSFFAIAQIGLPWSAGILLTLVLAVVLGLLIERIALRPLIGEPVISMIMVTVGLSSVLRAVVNAIWGARPRTFPAFLPRGEIAVGSAVLGMDRLIVIPTAAVVLILLGLFFRYTRDGIAMRAIADDQQAALSMGISIKRVIGIAWALACVSAALGGIMLGEHRRRQPEHQRHRPPGLPGGDPGRPRFHRRGRDRRRGYRAAGGVHGRIRGARSEPGHPVRRAHRDSHGPSVRPLPAAPSSSGFDALSNFWDRTFSVPLPKCLGSRGHGASVGSALGLLATTLRAVPACATPRRPALIPRRPDPLGGSRTSAAEH